MSVVYFDDALSQIEFPAFLRERGLADNSWHNDVNPKATLPLSGGRTLFVWVAPDALEDREDTAMRKYAVEIYPDDCSEGFFVGETDCAWACAALVDAVVKRDADGELAELAGAGP